jgi:outer membrane protein TolC
MKNNIFIIVLLVQFTSVFAQDTNSVLKYNEFISQVMTHHPSAYQAELIKDYGDAKLLSMKGYTDPKIFSDINQKYFSDKQYYSYFSGGIKVPTWYGISVEAGYSLTDGDFINPENRLPETGLVYAGIKLDLGNGLIWNERRYALESGKIIQQSSEIERQIFLNELRYKATEAYLKWYANYQKYTTFLSAVENAEIRLKAVKASADFGDRPIIDTTEAFISLSNRILEMQTTFRDLQNSEAFLETYLWSNGEVPLELDGIIPEIPQESEIYIKENNLNEDPIAVHPFIQIQEFKLSQSNIKLKLQKEQLKPDFSLKYNMLNEPIGTNPIAQYNVSNYQWGASFNYSILSRKQRGDVQLAKIQLEDQKLSLRIKQQEINYKISAAQNNYSTALSQAILTDKIVQSNLTLYRSEQAMFGIGESSVFMMNTRETNYIKAQKENIDAKFSQFQTLNELRYIMQY